MCVALAALDARVQLVGAGGVRTVPLVDLHRLPGERPDLETVLEPGELIAAVELPPSPFGRSSAYRKVRDRASYAFALVSVAAGLDRARGQGRRRPHRARGRGAQAVARRSRRGGAARRPGQREAFEAALDDELADARPLGGNAFKIDLAKRTLGAVLTELSGSSA